MTGTGHGNRPIPALQNMKDHTRNIKHSFIGLESPIILRKSLR